MAKNNLIGKMAVISTTPESLATLNITLKPGDVVNIIRYDGHSDTHGPCYEVTDGVFDNFGFIIPSAWLNVLP